jgi:cyclophilin family peptidyl-prolyl cis-trans isomerase
MVLLRNAIAATLVAAALGGAAVAAEKGNPMVVLSTSIGDMKVELNREKTPVTVQNFLGYVKAGFYDGTLFHRVIPGFMIQGGGLTPDMRDKREGQRPPIKNEAGNGLKNEVGTLAMARTSVSDSATSQFFINVENNGFLDKENTRDNVGYAVFGRIVEGMGVVRKIEQVKADHQGAPPERPSGPGGDQVREDRGRVARAHSTGEAAAKLPPACPVPLHLLPHTDSLLVGSRPHLI